MSVACAGLWTGFTSEFCVGVSSVKESRETRDLCCDYIVPKAFFSFQTIYSMAERFAVTMKRIIFGTQIMAQGNVKQLSC